MALLALLTVSCATPSPAATATPTPTPVVTPTPTVVTPEGPGVPGADPKTIPEAVAPQQLGRTILPINPYQITSRFQGLQWRLNSRQRTLELDKEVSGHISASYGRTQPVGCGIVGLSARNVSTGEFYPPGWMAEQVVAHFTTGADWEVEDFGREGQLYWVTWNTTCSAGDSSSTDDLYMITWGKAGTPWVYSALGSTPEERRELVAAFVRKFR